MKKILLIITLLSSTLALAHSSFKVRTGAFIPQTRLFRDIYSKANPFFEAELATRVCESNWDLWLNFDWMGRKGRSIGLCNPTKIQIANISFGANYIMPFCECWEFYLGLGPTFGAVRLKNNSICGCEKITKPAFGFVTKTGFQRYFSECYFFDIFVDYAWQRVTKFERCNVNVGGVRVGVGLGTTF